MIAYTNIHGKTISALLARRHAVGLTRQELAARAGCSLSYVQLLETGFTPSRSHVLPQILAALEKAEGGLGENEDDRALHVDQ